MKANTSTILLETSGTSNRRQPVRQTRTNPSRNATSSARSFGGKGSFVRVDERTNAGTHGFFPAITHFTDSISVVPKEMIRHYTMLKEVDAKIYGPEDNIKQLVAAALNSSLSPQRMSSAKNRVEQKLYTGLIPNRNSAGSASGVGIDTTSPDEKMASQTEAAVPVDSANISRRQLFYQLRFKMNETLMILDEKNHVMSTATDALEKLLARCESSYPHIASEISEEARYGNLHHWAYMDKTAEKKGTTAGERTRREAAVAHGMASSATMAQEVEPAPMRGESRREVLAARKQRVQQLDSDFDDGRAAKKPSAAGKSRKVVDTTATSGAGLGITNGQSAPGAGNTHKRRKIEKSTPAGLTDGLAMERSMSAVFGANGVGSRAKAGASPRDTPTIEKTKKRARAGTITNGAGTGNGRRRIGTQASAANSPSLASSPVVGTFTAAVKANNGPALNSMQRSASTRGRQNSAQSVLQDASRNRPPSSTSNKQANGNVSYADSALNRGKVDFKTALHEALDAKSHDHDALNPDVGSHSRGHDRTVLKREDPEQTRTQRARPSCISTATGTRATGKASKTGTPVLPSFPEPSRPRAGRNPEPTIKRSHKKGAGLAAQLAAQAAAAEEDGNSSGAGDEEIDHVGEERYCYCNGYSYGEMVACDMDGCAREWFHLQCAGLTKAPNGKTKWYCDDCKKKFRGS